MLLLYRFLKNNSSNTLVTRNFNDDVKNEIISCIKDILKVFVTRSEYKYFSRNCQFHILKNFRFGSLPAYGKSKLTSRFLNVFCKNKIDETSVWYLRQMEFSRKRISPIIKKVWKKRKKFRFDSINRLVTVKFQFLSTMNEFIPEEIPNTSKICRDVVVLESNEKNLDQFIKDIRTDVYTPYGQWIKEGWGDKTAESGTFIKVVSYNILAQNLLESHPGLYTKHEKQYLCWKHRSSLLIKQFIEFDADILCLQEVEAAKVDFFNGQLGIIGYKGVFKKRTNDKEDGCAIYFRENKFDFKEHVSVEYYQPSVSVLNRDNIGLVVRLSPKNYPEKNIIVATTHLLFNPRRHDIKLAQMQIMLAEIDRIACKCTNEYGQSSYYPIILTGDFNLTPYSTVYNLLVNGFVNDCQPNTSTYSHHNQLIPIQLGITDSCQHYDLIQNRHSMQRKISDFQYVRLYNSDRKSLSNYNWRSSHFDPRYFESGTLYHYLNFASAYPHDNEGINDATTFQLNWCTVDYIFYGRIENRNRTKIDGELKLVSYLKLPNFRQASFLGTIPNEICPSDHLPLSATFHLPVQV